MKADPILDRLFPFSFNQKNDTYQDISEPVKARDKIPMGSNTLVTRLLDEDITWYEDDPDPEEDIVI